MFSSWQETSAYLTTRKKKAEMKTLSLPFEDFYDEGGSSSASSTASCLQSLDWMPEPFWVPDENCTQYPSFRRKKKYVLSSPRLRPIAEDVEAEADEEDVQHNSPMRRRADGHLSPLAVSQDISEFMKKTQDSEDEPEEDNVASKLAEVYAELFEGEPEERDSKDVDIASLDKEHAKERDSNVVEQPRQEKEPKKKKQKQKKARPEKNRSKSHVEPPRQHDHQNPLRVWNSDTSLMDRLKESAGRVTRRFSGDGSTLINERRREVRQTKKKRSKSKKREMKRRAASKSPARNQKKKVGEKKKRRRESAPAPGFKWFSWFLSKW